MANFELPSAVKAMLAERARRLHHFIWHSVRDSWHDFPPEVQQELTDLGWAPPRPSFLPDGNLNLTNNSGEDFLFMHREMIAHANAALASAGDPNYQQVVGWANVPQPNDAEFPVPPAYSISQGGQVIVDTNDVKSDDFYFRPPDAAGRGGGMQHWDLQLENPQILRNITLGQLGTYLEFTIHNWMHMRFSRDPGEMRPDVRPNQASSIETRWDAVEYDWLGDTYSSHTENHFWKLHGLIDRRIDQWATANNVHNINWIGTWVGKMPPAPVHHIAPESVPRRRNVFAALQALSETQSGRLESAHHDHGHGNGHIDEMEHIANLIQDCGVHYHFYDEVRVDSPENRGQE
jgi:hypothetical protein